MRSATIRADSATIGSPPPGWVEPPTRNRPRTGPRLGGRSRPVNPWLGRAVDRAAGVPVAARGRPASGSRGTGSGRARRRRGPRARTGSGRRTPRRSRGRASPPPARLRWGVDQHEPRLVAGRAHRWVVGRGDEDRRVGHRPGRAAEEGVELGVVVGPERTPCGGPVPGWGRPARAGRAAARSRRGCAGRAGPPGGGGAAGPGRAATRPHWPRPRRPGHWCRRPVAPRSRARRPPRPGSPVVPVWTSTPLADGQPPQRVGEAGQPAAHVPPAVGELGVRDGQQRGRSPPRVRADVGGVPVEQRAQVRLAEVGPADGRAACARVRSRRVRPAARPAGPPSAMSPHWTRARVARRCPSTARARRHSALPLVAPPPGRTRPRCGRANSAGSALESSTAPSAKTCRTTGSSGDEVELMRPMWSPLGRTGRRRPDGRVSRLGPVSNRNTPAAVGARSRPSLPPTWSACSSTLTRCPAAASRVAAASPPTPAPTTMTRASGYRDPRQRPALPGQPPAAAGAVRAGQQPDEEHHRGRVGQRVGPGPARRSPGRVTARPATPSSVGHDRRGGPVPGADRGGRDGDRAAARRTA